MAPRVLISDSLSPAAVQIFKDRGIEVDFQPNLGKDKDKLAELIGNYDGLAIRSATKVTPKILEKAKNLKVIGRAGTLPDKTFLPGLDIRYGAIVVDEEKLAYPGDILHEAGHIAVSEPEARKAPTLAPTDGEEIATLAWSYAALRHLDLAPDIVFHPDGYKGGSQSLIENFSAGCYLGVPLLQYYGLTVEPKFAAERGVEPFPHMLRWLRA